MIEIKHLYLFDFSQILLRCLFSSAEIVQVINHPHIY